jgi:hypothetical protein
MPVRLRPRLSYANVAATLALVCATAGVAFAAIPGRNGTIKGCYAKRSGALRVISDRARCRHGERTLSWNQRGPTGRTGAIGRTGPQGLAGQNGATRVVTRSAASGTTAMPGGVVGVPVSCAPGERAVGGGAFANAATGIRAAVQTSVPVVGADGIPTGWSGTVQKIGPDADTTSVVNDVTYVICAAP